MKYKVLIINGKAGVGKSTAVSLIKDLYPYVLEVSMVDPAKDMMRAMGKDPEEKTQQSRAFLCELKNLLDRYYNMSFANLFKKIGDYTFELQQYGLDEDFLVIVHSREKNDIKKLKMMFDAKTLLIESQTRGIDPEDASNAADADIYNTNYDFTIYNDGTIDDLSNKLRGLLKEWK